jgi:hypothetical protein
MVIILARLSPTTSARITDVSNMVLILLPEFEGASTQFETTHVQRSGERDWEVGCSDDCHPEPPKPPALCSSLSRSARSAAKDGRRTP